MTSMGAKPKSVGIDDESGVSVAETKIPLLQVEDLRTSFFTGSGEVKAVDGLNLQIDAGETLGLVGESGCGKSVTALSILRLIENPPGRIVGGQIKLQGHDLLQVKEEAMRQVRGKKIAMIFQEPGTALNPVFTVGSQIAAVLRSHQQLNAAAAWQKAVELLAQAGIPDAGRRAHDYPHQLSGGLAQRVMIAMAISCHPKLLIADEPTTALDVTIQAQILDLLIKLKETLGMAVILITHDLGVVAETAQRVAVMYAGKIVEEAPVRELFRTPLHPYTQGLLASMPSLSQGKRQGQRLNAIPGSVPKALALPPGCRFAPRCPKVIPDCTRSVPDLREVSPDHRARCILA
jgi:peptide/nickel transport system ATP-binding protein